MAKSPKLVMDADVYDYLEFAALAFGGIGRSAFYDEIRTSYAGPHPVEEVSNA